MLGINLLPTRRCKNGLHTVSTGFKQCPKCVAVAKAKHRLSPLGQRTRAVRVQTTHTYRLFNEHHLSWSYGLSLEDFAWILHDQNFRCAGCRELLKLGRFTSAKERADAAHVDHCHKTGKVRGLLCRGCNAALGQVCDNPDTLRGLARYLENPRE